MSKGKKAVIALLTFVIATVGIVYGLFIYTSQMPSETELLLNEQAESKDFKKYKVYENDTPFYVSLDKVTNVGKDTVSGYIYDYDFVKPIMENVNSSYIWVNCDDNICYGVSRENLLDKINQYSDKSNERNDFDTTVRACKFLVTNMTGKAGQTTYPDLQGKKNIYWYYAGGYGDPKWRTLSAFSKAVPAEEFYEQVMSSINSNILRSKGLRLEIENPVVEKVLCVDDLISMNIYCMMISADVTTKKKPAEFDKCSWIPDEGETKNITFVIMTTSNKTYNAHFVTDIAVVGYN